MARIYNAGRYYGSGAYSPNPNHNIPETGWYGYTAYGSSRTAAAPVDNGNNRRAPMKASALRNKQSWEMW